MKLEAQSISFASMDDAEFEQVYSAVADVILQKVLVTYAGRDELDDVMRKVVGFL
jgi:lipoate synthase